MGKPKPDYTIRLVLSLLEGYEELSHGKLPWAKFADYGVKIDKTGSNAMPLAPTLKADIDRAIRYSLKPMERCIIVSRLISGWQETIYWVNLSTEVVRGIELKAVNKIVLFLNQGIKKGSVQYRCLF